MTDGLANGIKIGLLAMTLAVAGCSTEAWYEGTKRSAETECRRQPPGSVDDCLARVSRQSYPEYEKERQRARQGGD